MSTRAKGTATGYIGVACAIIIVALAAPSTDYAMHRAAPAVGQSSPSATSSQGPRRCEDTPFDHHSVSYWQDGYLRIGALGFRAFRLHLEQRRSFRFDRVRLEINTDVRALKEAWLRISVDDFSGSTGIPAKLAEGRCGRVLDVSRVRLWTAAAETSRTVADVCARPGNHDITFAWSGTRRNDLIGCYVVLGSTEQELQGAQPLSTEQCIQRNAQFFEECKVSLCSQLLE